ncbi:MAG: flavodoxin-dependent (E)-4-hydroxy-3-methylbut-2-enyl-diphosphate synthase, partial [Planctomycetia bacterium]
HHRRPGGARPSVVGDDRQALHARSAITIAVMGCRVNGPGETDDADLGLWCGPTHVNLKRRSAELGAFPYDAILPRLREELDRLIAARA